MINQKRMFSLIAMALIILGASIYFSSQKLKQQRDDRMIEPPVVVEQPKTTVAGADLTAEVVSSPVPGQSPGEGNPQIAVEPKPGPSLPPANCHSIPEFNQVKRELGRIVNQHELREHNVPLFLKKVNEFRLQKGIPLPLVTDPAKLDQADVVYNRCHPSCRGNVNAVFVSRLIAGQKIEVLTRKGGLVKLPVHESGLDVITVDELNAKGVPFKSWRVPVMDSGWYIEGPYLYYPLDIEGAWLQADTKGNWNLVGKPKNLLKLVEIEPAVKLPGCTNDDHCFQISGANPTSPRARHFKAPRACEPILKHSQDEPVDEEQKAEDNKKALAPEKYKEKARGDKEGQSPGSNKIPENDLTPPSGGKEDEP